MKEILLRYARYNHWANSLLFGLMANRTDETIIDKEIISSFSSLRKTVYHIWDAENIWMNRLRGEPVSGWPSRNFTGEFDEALKRLSETDLNLIHFVMDSDDEKLSGKFSYRSVNGTEFTSAYFEAIHHCFNHSSFHRGQLVTILRQCGFAEIPQTDFIPFYLKIKHKDNL